MALIPDYRIATLVAGIATLAIAVIIVGMSPRSPLHRATAGFFGLRGLWFTTVAALSANPALSRNLVPYVLLAIPGAAVWMAFRMHQAFANRPGPAWARPVALTILGATLVLDAIYLIDHATFHEGPLRHLEGAAQAVYFALASFMAWEFLAGRGGACRRGLYAFVLGFIAEPVFHATFILGQQIVFGGPWTPLMTVSAIVMVGVVGGLSLTWSTWDSNDRARLLTVVGLAFGTGALTILNVRFGFTSLHLLGLPTMNAFWTLWVVGAAGYATLRYRVFTLDARVKWFLRYGSAAGLLTATFWTLGELLEQQFQASTTTQSLVVAAGIALATYPLLAVTKRLADRWMPGVENSEDYRGRRRVEIYSAAFERASRDGLIDVHEKMALERLAKGLGLSRAAAEKIEKRHRSSPA